ncbi:conserved hypothetical protein [Ricinus communis]|uniref:Uncharacterized protein n=1 Tax=Ricinus communis TaxID=3988 RepID=B9SIJ7_RICCO|nr:conserved hypothetical protein [Ricinus communis]
MVEFIHVYGSKRSSGGLDWKAIEKNFRDEAGEDGLLLGDDSLDESVCCGLVLF